jgi:hypothetical protein
VRNGFVRGGGNWTTMLDDHNLSNRVCLDVYSNENDYANGIALWVGCSAHY